MPFFERFMRRSPILRKTNRSPLGVDHRVAGGLLLLVVTVYTLLLSPVVQVQPPSYAVGGVADRDIKATHDFFIEDAIATETRRQQAVATIRTVYDYDSAMATRTGAATRSAFAAMRAERDNLATVVAAATEPTESAEENIADRLWQKKTEFEKTIGLTVEKGSFRALIVNGFDREIEDVLVAIVTDILTNGVVANKELMLKEEDRGVILRDLANGSEQTTARLKRYYGLDQSKTMVRIVGQPLLKGRTHADRTVVVDLCQNLIQPNITLNRSETETRKKQAVGAVKPALYQMKAGEMILREGERITATHLLKLDKAHATANTDHTTAKILGAALLMLCLILASFLRVLRGPSAPALTKRRNLVFLAVVLMTFFGIARIAAGSAPGLAQGQPFGIEALFYGVPLAAGPMLICLFLGFDIAASCAVIIAMGGASLFGDHFHLLVFFLISGIIGAYWMRDCRERKIFIIVGLKTGLANAVVILAVAAATGRADSLAPLWDVLFAALGGLGAGIAIAGIAPIFEWSFNYTTNITLLELANLDRPLLHRLMLEAPGTYHHSVIVGSMVEAAAADIGANSLLAKVCGYYHDIGKVNKPLYFIENQGGGQNKHDKLAPSMSKRILIAHVKDGVEMARQHRLGQSIMDTIAQSHGTSLIRFFYDKAVKQKGEENVNANDYCYPGPKPQTREAGLVMLADVVEAASRTLDNPTPARIQGLVQRLINKIFSDGQLSDCELTLRDLNGIAKSFIKILNAIHHHRIDYPERSTGANGKQKNGHSDRKPSPPHPDADDPARDDDDGRLKRLGLS